MSVAIIEKHDSRGYTISAIRGSGEWHYLCLATAEADPETAVGVAVLADAPYFWGGLARRELTVQPIGGGYYEVTVPYSIELDNAQAQDPTASPDPGTGGPGGGPPSGTPTGPASDTTPLGANISLEISGRPPKITTSRNVVFNEMAGGGDAPNHGKIINYNRVTNEVDGTEIDDPTMVMMIDVTMDYITMGYINRLNGAVWSKNNATWWRRAAGSAVFMGATFQSTDDGRVRGSFRFGLRMPETIDAGDLRDDPDPGDEHLLPTAPVVKAGWDYLEIQYENVKDSATGLLVARPMAMRVHETLPDFDFALFGIGGA